ncbi:hypothetical protein PENTCL1PPCAC_11641, partial [Pristionchus entomophagus]
LRMFLSREFFLILLMGVATVLAEEAKKEKTEEKPKLPYCKHVDPYKDLKAWHKVNNNGCNSTSNIDKMEADEKERKSWGEKKFAFDMVASDKIGPKRDNGIKAHDLCAKEEYNAKYTVSIVVIFHNEALSVLLRMIQGIFDRTPADLLKQIVLFDDASEEECKIHEKISEYAKIAGWDESKLTIKRQEYRLGLIKAKVRASRLATAEVIIFFDSHCEVTDNWLPPLLQPIKEDPKSVVLPIVDMIHPATFEYSGVMISKGGFDWGLNFKWDYLPWSYFDEPENHVKPFKSPAMSGGLLAVKRDYFKELGEYDEGMEIWGAENIELSLRVWMCGGRVLVAPCSRIGHVFRMWRPYKGKAGMDTNLYNSVRVAETWLGEYKDKYYKTRSNSKGMDFGDIGDRMELKENLKCKDMKWFVEHIYPELLPKKHDEL